MNEMNPTPVQLVDPLTTKCAMVLDADLPLGLIANTAAVLALTIGFRVPLIGPDVQDGAQSTHVGLTTMPVPILRADANVLKELREKAQQMENMLLVDVTDAAQTTTNYEDYTAKLSASSAEALRYLGVAFFGPKKLVNRLVGNLPLLR
jgi:hypothetical protein